MISLNETCVVFDLDDTLYSESDYQQSGFNAISELCLELFKKDVSLVIKQAQDENQDVISSICLYLNLPDSVKESLIWHYRLHNPAISLNNDVKELVDITKANAKHVAIITDGREVSQRQKLRALGLDDIPAFISESWGETKPGKLRYQHVMNTLQAKKYVYIGDNLKKDFITPNNLGWLTIGIKDKGRNIHSQKIIVARDFFPQVWFKNIAELKKSLFN